MKVIDPTLRRCPALPLQVGCAGRRDDASAAGRPLRGVSRLRVPLSGRTGIPGRSNAAMWQSG